MEKSEEHVGDAVPVPVPPKKTWQEILIDESYLTPDAIESAEAEAKALGIDPLDALFSSGVITKDLFGQAIAEYYGVAYADINTHPPTKEEVLRIPEDVARRDRRVIFRDSPTEIVIATDHPHAEISEEFRSHFPGKTVTLAYALPEDLEMIFANYRKALDTRFAKIVAEQGKVAPEVVDEIMLDAVTFRASDIHFEPREKDVLIRFRVDGLLEEAGRLGKELYENVLNRIKVQAHLRTDEHFSAQDGAIRYHLAKQVVDVRVSIVPLVDGEKVVMRLLSEYMRGYQLTDLGLSPTLQRQLTVSAEKPFGMILVIGPTGSGKTTTLYAAVKFLNRPDVNISTIEDPVEYKILGVNHIQVNLQTQLTFSKGLRSIVRQDPDIILVGEIRDMETAEIAVNAALTGHMLLSTFHANDAASAIPRLMDMGVEPFLLSSTIELIVAQRLARKICETCRFGTRMSRDELTRKYPSVAKYFPGESMTLYRGKGCTACAGSGYKGRIGLFEFIQATQDLRDLVMRRPSAKDVMEVAMASGTKPMFLDGIEKVQNGVITVDELMRVAAPPEGDRK